MHWSTFLALPRMIVFPNRILVFPGSELPPSLDFHRGPLFELFDSVMSVIELLPIELVRSLFPCLVSDIT